MLKIKHASGYLLPLVLVTTPYTAIAQESDRPKAMIEEIMVTAQRREERAHNVPISITSMNEDALREANVKTLSDIAELTPALRFDYNAAFVQPTIRGIGTAVVTSGGTSNVGIYVDGFYSANPLAADMEMANITAVDVLKGPQGTLFGRNATGGAILVTTSDPEKDFRGTVEAGYERFNARKVKAYMTTGVTENLMVDLAASYRAGDGFVNNIIPNGPQDPAQHENTSIRGGVKLELSETSSLLFRYTHHDINDATNIVLTTGKQGGETWRAGEGAEFWPYPADEGITTKFRETALSGDYPTPKFKLKSDIFQVTGSFEFPWASFFSYTQYREDDTATLYDQDSTAHPVIFNKFYINDTTFSQEFLLVSNQESRLQWTAGAFYFNYENTFDPIDYSLFGAPFTKASGSNSVTETLAGFIDATYQLTDRLFLTLGGRYSHDEFSDSWVDIVDFSTGNIDRVKPADLSDNNFTPRIVLRYEMDQASVYASYTQGYKAPIIDLIRPGGPANVNSEQVDAFEIGYKYAGDKLSFNIAGWYYDYKDLQVSSYPRGLSSVSNAATAEIYGVEAETRYYITPNLDINVGAAWMKAEYDSFPDASRFYVCRDMLACGDSYGLLLPVTYDASGLSMARAPEVTANLGIRYGYDLLEGRLTHSLNLYHTSKVYFDSAAQFYQDAYTLLGIRSEWQSGTGRYSFAVYGDNITNENYYNQSTVNSFGGTVTWGAPATWGVSARIDF